MEVKRKNKHNINSNLCSLTNAWVGIKHPNLKHHNKKYPQTVKTMIKMKKRPVLNKWCFPSTLTSARSKHILWPKEREKKLRQRNSICHHKNTRFKSKSNRHNNTRFKSKCNSLQMRDNKICRVQNFEHKIYIFKFCSLLCKALQFVLMNKAGYCFNSSSNQNNLILLPNVFVGYSSLILIRKIKH